VSDVESGINGGGYWLGQIRMTDKVGATNAPGAEHESPVLAPPSIVDADLATIGTAWHELANGQKVDACHFEPGGWHHTRVSGLVAKQVLHRDARLLGRRRPQAGRSVGKLGDVAGGEDKRIRRAHVLVDNDTDVYPQTGRSCQYNIRPNASRDHAYVRAQSLAVRQLDRLDPLVAKDTPRLHLRQDLDSQVAHHLPHERAGWTIELAG